MPHAISSLPLIDARRLQTGKRSGHSIAQWQGIIDLARTPADIAHQVEEQLRAEQIHEPEFEVLRGLAGSDALLLDVGANRGQTILSAKSLCPDLRIYSVEPNRYARPYLDEAAKRFSGVTVASHGLGDTEAQLTLWIPVIDGLLVSPLGSAHPETYLEDPMKSWLAEIAAGTPVQYTRVEVTIRRGDDLDLAPDVIKIDVEHHEIPVLRGLEQTIRRCRPLLIIEKGQPFAISEHLRRQLGYDLFQYVPPSDLYRLDIQPETLSETLPLNLVCFPGERLDDWFGRLNLRVMA